MSTQKILDLKNYKITYKDGKTFAYKDIEIYEGEFVGIMGKSGCGKTSLLNSLFSVNFPGSIEYEKYLLLGRELKSWKREKFSYISYMPQFSQDALNPSISVEDHLKLTLKGNKLSYERNKAIEILKALNLNEDVLKKYPYELSGGMKQRVLLMLCYIKEPRILVLDEPSSALDFITLKTIIEFLKYIENTLTIIIVSHDEGFLQNICNRVINI